MLKAVIYKTESGKEPFIEWKDGLDVQTQARIDVRIRRVESSGVFGDFDVVDDGVFELRFHFGPGYRVYFGKYSDKLIILLFGGSKKHQSRDIKKAKEYWDEYLFNQGR
jgi:putative addiction module killer protein